MSDSLSAQGMLFVFNDSESNARPFEHDSEFRKTSRAADIQFAVRVCFCKFRERRDDLADHLVLILRITGCGERPVRYLAADSLYQNFKKVACRIL